MKKSVPCGTDLNDPEIVIPELEEAAEQFVPKRSWSERDINILKKYYGRVSTAKLAGYLHRTGTSVQQYADRLNIKKRDLWTE